MAKIDFTPNQRAAIDADNGNILISAAAGSGKTAVLTERVIRLMTKEQPVAADRLIIVTFTLLASVEMRQRIEKKLSDLIEENPENDWLQTQHMLLSNAKIGTIHSLCSGFLKDHFQVLGLPIVSRIADENELNTLYQDMAEQLLEAHYQSGEEDFLVLADMFSGYDDRQLLELILGIYHWSRSYPFPESMLRRFEEQYESDTPFSATEWCRLICRHLLSMTEQGMGLLSWALKQAETDELLRQKYVPAITHDYDVFQALYKALEMGDWDTACSIAADYQKQRLGVVRGHENPDWLKEIQSRRSQACDLLQKTMLPKYLSITEALFQEDKAFLRPILHAVFTLVGELSQAVEQEKRAREIMDFPDLEHQALRLLVREEDGVYYKTEEAKSIGAQYDEIMVDECQDINQIQNLIFWALSHGPDSVRVGSEELVASGGNLFFVGDVKQSIYRFRNAMPSLFTLRKRLFSEQENASSRKILLQNNFRSRREVTDAVNQVFSAIMTEQLGELAYDGEEALVYSANYQPAAGCEAEFHLLDLPEIPKEEKQEKNFAREARYIGLLIQSMVRDGHLIEDHGTLRACTWKDFCILLRSKKGKTALFTDVLKQLGIPCYAEAGQGYFDSFEVSVMLSLLRVIDNPMLDIDLFTVMMSPMFLFSVDDLAKIRLKDRKAALYTAVNLAAQEGDAACREFLETLSYLRTQAVILPIDRLIQLIYDRTGFLFVVESMVSGEQKRANLRLLLSYAENYEKIGNLGLDGFLRFVQRAIDRGDDFVCANTVSERADVVRIMSIHGSKGLEFPICIVADLSKRFNLIDLNQSVMMHMDYGFGMKIRKPDTYQSYSTLPWEAIRLAQKQESLSEEMRILYVAMTRAREKLILVGSAEKLPERCQKNLEAVAFEGEVKPYALLNRASVLDWLVMALSEYPEFLEAVSDWRKTARIGAWNCIFARAEETAELPEEGPAFSAQPSNKILAQIEEAIGYVYPDEALQAVPAKVTVTQIAKSKQREALAQLEPMDLSGREILTGAQRGTVLHSFMQYADFHAAGSELEKEIERLVDQGFLSEAEADCLNRRAIKAFFQSSLFKRMMESDMLEREYQFIYEITAGEVDDTLKPPFSEERILIQGIADAVFIEDGELVIVDYKTDRMRNPSDFAEKYADQLRIYKEALRQYFELPVKECLIYSLHLATEIKVW
ncbi:helicase-exonuclease AddAB subunit AddA [Massiliimalia massiliensis]|uniref:helicase-exonuclease AddAB subunit AddA n=1 Tax=Massiliimalia massiliensis TaxID=1852384 RepID=UPI00135632C0|nr:helicase-exonuclease AddAB subunit AddA [Massiliimalia massiliensis]